MDIRDMKLQLEMLQLKVNALTDHVYDHLSQIETSIEMDWIEPNPVAKRYLIENMRDIYITSTVASDIEKDVERLYEEICKEKASTSLNFGESDVPATNEQ
ncbi:hypothetical protein [Macrococcus epidermidis]|uniref:hypothetical protein n=1 Tax=Macrococcus epidermidis TaxID=1902580 RepID=UPI0020B8D86A|nr:hypothetical protein [Macrococcus epidermidis]UTH16960.1 hypothetical protein KFV12_04090 [Macrococcus epidermidis]